MRDFNESIQAFHAFCDAGNLDRALHLFDALNTRAATASDFFLLGTARLRLGHFREAERALEYVWHDTTLDLQDRRRVGDALLAAKYQLGKAEEGEAIETLVSGPALYCYEIPGGATLADEFQRMLRERLLQNADPVAGQTVLMITSGGLGDAIQQIRHVEHLVAEGARAVVVNPHPALWTLFENSRVPATLAHTQAGDIGRFGRVALSNVMGMRYRIQGASVAPGYLRPHALPARPQAGDKRRIGLVWRSTNATSAACGYEPFRSMALSALEPLLAESAAQFYSLQFGGYTADEAERLAHHGVVDAAPAIHSVADLAHIMLQLDGVVTIDSAPAHLAGALDVPVWNLLAAVSDWRWGVNGQPRTALYPSMRIVRQSRLGDWTPVIADVAAQLRGEFARRV